MDLLDEKALVILKGLEQLKIIALKPILVDEGVGNSKDVESDNQQTVNKLSPLENFKLFSGSLKLHNSCDDVDASVNKMREGSL